MRRRAPDRASARAGFSLIEMLAALAILALMVGMATQLGRRPSPRLRVESATRSLCAALRQTRMRAIAVNEEIALTVDLRRKAFSSPVVAETRLPDDARIDLTVSSVEKRSRDKARFAFYPSGGSSGGEMTMALAGVRAEIAVNWLTGATRCAVF